MAPKAEIYFPNDKQFKEALKKIPKEKRVEMEELLRADFKYLQKLVPEELPEASRDLSESALNEEEEEE